MPSSESRRSMFSTLGILAALLNYIPYIGPAAMTLILFGVGLVTFPSLAYAALPPAAFVALTTIEGHILTPMVLGRRPNQRTLRPVSWLEQADGALRQWPAAAFGLLGVTALMGMAMLIS